MTATEARALSNKAVEDEKYRRAHKWEILYNDALQELKKEAYEGIEESARARQYQFAVSRSFEISPDVNVHSAWKEALNCLLSDLKNQGYKINKHMLEFEESSSILINWTIPICVCLLHYEIEW